MHICIYIICFAAVVVRYYSTVYKLLLFSSSPILKIAEYREEEYFDGSLAAVCLTAVETFWQTFFFVGSISVFFILPFAVLLVLYTVIARHLMNNPGITSHGNRSNVLKYRKQVIFMLGAVVISFFICLLPFRAFTLWIIVMPPETINDLGLDGYYAVLYFCRIMLYLNSAMNPILYNLMSSKFREGFLRLLGCKGVVRGKLLIGARKGTFHTTSTNLSSSQGDKRRSGRIKEDSDILAASFIIRACSEDVLMLGVDMDRSEIRPDCSSTSSTTSSDANRKINGFAKRKRSTFDDIEELEEELPDTLRRTGDAVHSCSPMRKTNKRKIDREVIFCHQNGNNSSNKDADQHITSTENEVGDATATTTSSVAHTVTTAASPMPPSIITSHMRRKAFAIGRKKTVSIDSCDSVIKYDDDSVADDVVDKTTTVSPINGIRVQYSGDDNEAKTFLHNRIGRESFV